MKERCKSLLMLALFVMILCIPVYAHAMSQSEATSILTGRWAWMEKGRGVSYINITTTSLTMEDDKDATMPLELQSYNLVKQNTGCFSGYTNNGKNKVPIKIYIIKDSRSSAMVFQLLNNNSWFTLFNAAKVG